MPSIAGTGIVACLLARTPQLRKSLFFGDATPSLDTPTLTLLILYGNLFCYVASYPILCFHVTRSIDFKDYRWQHRRTDGYIATAAVGGLLLVAALWPWWPSGGCRVAAILLITAMFSGLQLVRSYQSLRNSKVSQYSNRHTSLLYAYLMSLAERRGVILQQETAETTPKGVPDEGQADLDAEADNEGSTIKEFVESYRHMREHSNSAFIFLLELILASACYGIIATYPSDTKMALLFVGVLFGLWSAPAACVHLLGQHLERRFSLFDDKRKRS
jgi:hypothetical protein